MEKNAKGFSFFCIYLDAVLFFALTNVLTWTVKPCQIRIRLHKAPLVKSWLYWSQLTNLLLTSTELRFHPSCWWYGSSWNCGLDKKGEKMNRELNLTELSWWVCLCVSVYVNRSTKQRKKVRWEWMIDFSLPLEVFQVIWKLCKLFKVSIIHSKQSNIFTVLFLIHVIPRQTNFYLTQT